MSAHPYDDLLAVCDADARTVRPGVAKLCGLVSAMPAELCADDAPGER